jgi:hypothetical protein
MAVRRAQASILSGVNSAANGITLDLGYARTSAGYIPTATSGVVSYTSSTTWTRPSNVHWIDIALVGGGGSSSQTVTGGNGSGGSTNRRGGGGGGGAVIQINQFYVGDYDTWYIIIGGNSALSTYGNNDCNGNSWGKSGNPTIFSPISSSYAITSLSGVDNSNLRRTLIAPGGGGAGHPCGSPGPLSLATAGGTGSNEAGDTFMYIPNTDTGGKVPWQGYGGRGGTGGAHSSPGGGGGGAGATASTSTGGTGRTLVSPFSGCYGGGGAGGFGTSGGCGGGSSGSAGTNGTGGGGGAAAGAFTGSLTGGTGRIEIRQWFSS